MRIQRSDISYDCALHALARLGFRVVKADNLMYELRKGNIHVVVRGCKGLEPLEIRFHEDRGRGSKHVTVESNSRLLRFRDRLEEALERQKLIEEEELKKMWSVGLSIDEYIKLFGCPFYGECQRKHTVDPTTCSHYYSRCEEYLRRKGKPKALRSLKRTNVEEK